MASFSLADMNNVLIGPRTKSVAEETECETTGILIVEIIRGKGFGKLGSRSDEIDSYIRFCIDGVHDDWVKTKTFNNEPRPAFNQRFLFKVPADKMEGAEVLIHIMDSDAMSSDDLKGQVKVAVPPAGEPFCACVDVDERLSNSKATPKLDLGIYLVSLDDVLKMPSLVGALQSQMASMVAEDDAEAEEMEALKAKMESMAADDEEDEAQKAEMAERIAAVEAEMAATAEAAQEAIAAKEAELAEAAAAAEAEAAEQAAAVEAAATAAAEAAEGDAEAQVAGLQAQVAALSEVLASVQGKLGEVQGALHEERVKSDGFERKIERMKNKKGKAGLHF